MKNLVLNGILALCLAAAPLAGVSDGQTELPDAPEEMQAAEALFGEGDTPEQDPPAPEYSLTAQMESPAVVTGQPALVQAVLYGPAGEYTYTILDEAGASLFEEAIEFAGPEGEVGEWALPSVPLVPEGQNQTAAYSLCVSSKDGEPLAGAQVSCAVVLPVLRILYEAPGLPLQDLAGFSTAVAYQTQSGDGTFAFTGLEDREFSPAQGLGAGSYSVTVSAPKGYQASVDSPEVEVALQQDARGEWVCEGTATVCIAVQEAAQELFCGLA